MTPTACCSSTQNGQLLSLRFVSATEPLEEGIERSQQLNATIKRRLESAAMYEDDLAEQDQIDAHESQAAYQQYMQQEQEPVRPTEPIVDATTETALDAQYAQ
ncbi:hypothetical protein OK016_15685 [Vibrio chagasii]|nr:hypothetical protein [Vibrio chagasii]